MYSEEFEPDEGDVIKARNRAELAEKLLSNPIFKEAFDFIDKQVYNAFCTIPTNNVDALMHVRLTKSVADNLKEYIQSVITTGKQTELTFKMLNEDKVI